MLEKDPGNPSIDRLRVIHLYEADFNWLLKQFWAKRMLHYGEAKQVLGEEQHGSRSTRMANDAVLLKLMSYDLSRVLKSNLATMDNDAKSCYDRIIIALGMLASRRLGMPASVARVHAETLRNMLHKIRTSHGVSKEAYSALQDLLCGVGQGSGAGPALWVAISVVLIECYKSTENGMIFTDPSNSEWIERWLDAFVDDAELGMNDFYEEHSELSDLIAEFQKAAQKWERLLFTSGGALELSKCSWYCLHWSWDQHGHANPTIFGEHGPGLALTRGTDKSKAVDIKRLEVTEAHKTLGVRLEPMGIFDGEFAHLKRKADAIPNRLAGSSLGSYDSISFHQTTFLPSVGYSSPIIPLSFEACKQIQGKFIATLLNKISFNRNFPRAVVYGPIELGGLGIRSLYVEQGIAKISLYLRQLSSESELGKCLRIATRTQQLEAGVSWDILERPAITIPYLTTTWITALRDFMGVHDIQIKFCVSEKWSQYQTTCEGDTFLMERIMALNIFSDAQLRDINLARIYFRALTLSDVANPMGDRILPLYLEPSCTDPREHISTWKWPRQLIISEGQGNLWRQALRAAFLNRFDRLERPLGPWKCLTHRRHKFWIALSETKLMIREVHRDSSVHFVIHESQGGGLDPGFSLYPSEVIPSSAVRNWTFIPAEVTTDGDCYRVSHRGFDDTSIHSPSTPIAVNFTDFVASQDGPIRRLLARLQIVHSRAIDEIRDSWETHGDLVAATDGSAPSEGTFGWVVATESGDRLVECCGPVDGAPDQISSGRAESTSILSLGVFFKLVGKYLGHWPSGGHCKNVTDSRVALKRVQRASIQVRQLRSRLTSDIDCSTAYRNLGPPIYNYLEHQWIKGHQDNVTPSTFVQMN